MNRIIAIILLSSCLIACKKELRTKVYSLTMYRNSGFSGKLTLLETNDSTSTTVRIEADGLRPHLIYAAAIDSATIDSSQGTIMSFGNFMSTSYTIYREQSWNISFDNALKADACFVIHDTIVPPINNTKGYVLAGNIGKNAK